MDAGMWSGDLTVGHGHILLYWVANRVLVYENFCLSLLSLPLSSSCYLLSLTSVISSARCAAFPSMELEAVVCFCGAMATTTSLPNRPRHANFSICKLLSSSHATVDPGACSHKNGCFFGRKPSYQPCSIHVAQPFFINNFRRMAWSIRSSVDASGFDPSSSNNGRPRLIRAIQVIQSKLGVRLQELRRNLPMKILFFLLGFYCATAFATVIGQTGDWDILSAALAVLVVEGIGALMYRASLPVLANVRSLITMFNYWKSGLTLGLFLDSFKYEVDKITGFSDLINFEIDVFPVFL